MIQANQYANFNQLSFFREADGFLFIFDNSNNF